MKSRWTEQGAATAVERWGAAGDALALRTYTSRLIGAERGLVLHGGGNTSVKDRSATVLDAAVDVLYVKGSGWDLASIEPAGFPAVDLSWVRRLRGLTALTDEDMVNALRTHLLDASAPNPSIETLLHAFLPHRFVDHSHADAILALTNRADGEARVREALGDDLAIVPYVMAGFDLSKVAAEVADAHPDCIGLVLLHHGLFTFGDSARQSYERHIEVVSRAERALAAAISATKTTVVTVPHASEVTPRAARVAPRLRGAVAIPREADHQRWIVRFWDDPQTLELAAWLATCPGAGNSGPLTPDHVIRTKPEALVLSRLSFDDPDALRSEIQVAVADYGERYRRYVLGCAERAEGADAYTRLDDRPRVIWVPDVGLFTVGATAKACRVVADIARHTVALKRLAEPLGPYLPLSDDQLFEMEYWSLEQAKLGRGAPAPLAGRVALVTGGAGAIGVGVARQLLASGAHVVLADVSEPGLERAVAELGASEGLHTARMDVTDAESVAAGFEAACLRFGGVDVVVVNAGVAAVGALHDLSTEVFDRTVDINLGGAFRTLREAAQLLRVQGTGGDIVVVSTKNVMAPGAQFGAYSASKAGAHQLARVAALELAADGVRVNLITPDAVFSEGSVPSGLWQAVGPGRANARGLDPSELPAFYQDRNLLKAQVLATHVGNAVVFFASGQTPTTGAVLPVDGGVPGAFPR